MATTSSKLITIDGLTEFKTKYTDNYIGTLQKLVDDASGNHPGDPGYVATYGLATVKEYVDDKAISGSVVDVIKQATAETGYAATYVIEQNGVAVGEKINIPKDWILQNVTLNTCTTADVPEAGYVVGDKYFDFSFNTKDASETTTHVYLKVNELVDVYTSGSAATDEVVVAVDSSTNQITASITNGTITKDQLQSALSTEITNATTNIGNPSDSSTSTPATGLYLRIENIEDSTTIATNAEVDALFA